MNSAQAKDIVLVSVFISAALASVSSLSNEQIPSLKIGIGALVLAVFLLTLADISPKLAASFGFLVLVSAIFGVGSDTWNTLTKVTGNKPSK